MPAEKCCAYAARSALAIEASGWEYHAGLASDGGDDSLTLPRELRAWSPAYHSMKNRERSWSLWLNEYCNPSYSLQAVSLKKQRADIFVTRVKKGSRGEIPNPPIWRRHW
jgi:hypothetical protein